MKFKTILKLPLTKKYVSEDGYFEAYIKNQSGVFTLLLYCDDSFEFAKDCKTEEEAIQECKKQMQLQIDKLKKVIKNFEEELKQ